MSLGKSFPTRFYNSQSPLCLGQPSWLVLTNGKWVKVSITVPDLGTISLPIAGFRWWNPGKGQKSQDGRSQNPWMTYRWKLSVEQEHLFWTVRRERNYCVWPIIEFGSLVMAANVTLTIIRDKEGLIFSPGNGRKKPLTMKLNSSWGTSHSPPQRPVLYKLKVEWRLGAGRDVLLAPSLLGAKHWWLYQKVKTPIHWF